MATNGAGDKEYFEQQRQLLINDVAAVSLIQNTTFKPS